jgi:hypothetical protein
MTTKNIAGSTKDNLISLASLLALLLFFSFGSYFVNVLAQTPPDGNVAAPINTGTSTQTKDGGLTVKGGVSLGANGLPAFYAAQGSNETLLLFSQGGKLRVQENNGGNSSVITVVSDTVGINQSTPNSEADLDIGSKGIRLSGLTRNEWPRWNSRQTAARIPEDGNVAECPHNYVMTGFRIKHGSGDKEYIGMIFCRQLDGLHEPAPEEDEPLPPLCYTETNELGELVEVCK